MRLLECKSDGKFSLTQFFDDIPRYAILSHTWGPEEVTFRDMIEGNGTSKTSFDKIRFLENRLDAMACVTSGLTHAVSTNRAVLSSQRL